MIKIISIIIFVILLFGCSIPDENDRQIAIDECIDANKAAKKQSLSSLSGKIDSACEKDPVFTDCAISEGNQVLGSGCTLKYQGKTFSEKIQICKNKVDRPQLDMKEERKIISDCFDGNSEEGYQLLRTMAYVTNFVIAAGVIILFGTIFGVIYVSRNPDDIKRPKIGSSTLEISNTRFTVDDKLNERGDRYGWTIANCIDIKNRKHICKNDYQTFFRELGAEYVKQYDRYKAKINKQEVIELIQWSISIIPSVYTEKSKPQGIKREKQYLEIIDTIKKL